MLAYEYGVRCYTLYSKVRHDHDHDPSSFTRYNNNTTIRQFAHQVHEDEATFDGVVRKGTQTSPRHHYYL